MFYAELDPTHYLIRLERGEDIIGMLIDFFRDVNINNAELRGIGSIENPTLAHYKVDSKQYSEKELPGTFEITSLLGNIAILDDDIVIHPHITISNEQMQAFGGHLVKGVVSATMEIIVTVFPTNFHKVHDEDTGLNLWHAEGNQQPQQVDQQSQEETQEQPQENQ